MMKNSLLIFGILHLMSCQNSESSPNLQKSINSQLPKGKDIQQVEKGMSNPIMLSAAGGSDIGRLFNAYYRTGQVDKMIPLLDSKTKQSFSKEDLRKMLVNLQYGYDMKLSGAQKDGNRYTINYVCQIAQTKIVKQLSVIVEDDTARVEPMNLKSGLIFK